MWSFLKQPGEHKEEKKKEKERKKKDASKEGRSAGKSRSFCVFKCELGMVKE